MITKFLASKGKESGGAKEEDNGGGYRRRTKVARLLFHLFRFPIQCVSLTKSALARRRHCCPLWKREKTPREGKKPVAQSFKHPCADGNNDDPIQSTTKRSGTCH